MPRKPERDGGRSSGSRPRGTAVLDRPDHRDSARGPSPGRPPRISRPWQAFLTALLTLLILAGAYALLNRHWRPASTTLHLSGISSLDFKGQPVQADFSAFAGRIRLGSPSGQVDLALPVPNTSCQAYASVLGGICGESGLTLDTSLDAAWAAPEQVTMVTYHGNDANLSTDADGRVEVVVAGGGPARLCLARSLDQAKL